MGVDSSVSKEGKRMRSSQEKPGRENLQNVVQDDLWWTARADLSLSVVWILV